jgi:hypothetical protein
LELEDAGWAPGGRPAARSAGGSARGRPLAGGGVPAGQRRLELGAGDAAVAVAIEDEN